MLASSVDVKEVVEGIRWIIFVNLSTTTIIASFSCDFGSGPIISMDISCQGSSGAGKGFRGVNSGRRIILFFWHMSHPFTNCLTSVLIVGHQKFHLISSNMQCCPGCPMSGG